METRTGVFFDPSFSSEEILSRLPAEVKSWAEKVCGGRYLVLTHGCSRPDVAEFIVPGIIKILANDEEGWEVPKADGLVEPQVGQPVKGRLPHAFSAASRSFFSLISSSSSSINRS